MVSSLGGGIQLNALGDINLSLGGAINFIQSTEISDRVAVDTLYSDVTNLSEYPDLHQTTNISESNFITLSTKWKLNSNLIFSVSWEDSAQAKSDDFTWTIDSTSGLFHYWKDTSYVVTGMNYMKPEVFSLAFSFISDLENKMSIDFEYNQVSYNGHLNLKDYKKYKFGFEYLTHNGTPIRGGLVYQTAILPAMSPVSMFTFGTGKNIGNIIIDAAGTYCFQSFNYPDLFLVEDDIRPDYDLVRESQLHLQLDLSYKF